MSYGHERRKVSCLNLVVAGILIGLAIGIFLYLSNPIVKTERITVHSNDTFYSEINLLAVDDQGNGIATPLQVEVKPGDGKVLTDIEKLLFWTDTQQSIQTARDVAASLTHTNVSNYDITYSVMSNASVVGGPSAGAALTIATIAALENKTLENGVVMTGTINSNGSIGDVGGVLEKAQAAKSIGAHLFLVPIGQNTETELQPNETCSRRAGFLFCKTTYESMTINISKEAGIPIKEVGSIGEALRYFGL